MTCISYFVSELDVTCVYEDLENLERVKDGNSIIFTDGK